MRRGGGGAVSTSRGAPVRRHIRSFAWVGVDQLLSSLSNVVVAIAIARAAGTAGLGRYSVAFACYLLVLGFHRQLVTEPLLSLRWHPTAENTVHDAPALGASVLYLLAASLMVLVIGLATQRLELIVLAPLLPGVCVQDFDRYLAFRRQRQRLAAGLDALWVALSAFSCYWILRSGSPAVAVVGWGLAGGIAAVYGAIRLHVAPARPSVSVRWWRSEARRLGGFLTLAAIAYTAGSQGMLLAIAATIGEEGLGQLREAQILLGPAALSVAAFGFFVLPRLIRREEQITSRTSARLSLAAAVLAGGAAATSVVVAPPVSRLVFGHATAVSITLLVPLSLQLTFEAAAAGFVLPLQATQHGAAIAVARIVSVAVGVPCIILATVTGGIVLGGWALAAQAGVYLLAAWAGWTRTQGLPPAPGKEHGVDPRARTSDGSDLL
jgi:O-antigen/teichoic acid export membrane protein